MFKAWLGPTFADGFNTCMCPPMSYGGVCGGGLYLVSFSGYASVFCGYCSLYYFLHKYNTKLYNRVKEME